MNNAQFKITFQLHCNFATKRWGHLPSVQLQDLHPRRDVDTSYNVDTLYDKSLLNVFTTEHTSISTTSSILRNLPLFHYYQSS